MINISSVLRLLMRSASFRGSTRYNESRFLPAFLSLAAIPGHQPSPKHLFGGPGGIFRVQRQSTDEAQRDSRRRDSGHLSVLPVVVHPLDLQDAGRELLLALFGLRRDLESRSTDEPRANTGTTMTDARQRGQAARAQTVRDLRELIAALDGRMPQVQRAGEVAIARAAAALRAEALTRVEALERESAADVAPVDVA
jgi:hypothetical protein